MPADYLLIINTFLLYFLVFIIMIACLMFLSFINEKEENKLKKIQELRDLEMVLNRISENEFQKYIESLKFHINLSGGLNIFKEKLIIAEEIYKNRFN